MSHVSRFLVEGLWVSFIPPKNRCISVDVFIHFARTTPPTRIRFLLRRAKRAMLRCLIKSRQSALLVSANKTGIFPSQSPTVRLYQDVHNISTQNNASLPPARDDGSAPAVAVVLFFPLLLRPQHIQPHITTHPHMQASLLFSFSSFSSFPAIDDTNTDSEPNKPFRDGVRFISFHLMNTRIINTSNVQGGRVQRYSLTHSQPAQTPPAT